MKKPKIDLLTVLFMVVLLCTDAYCLTTVGVGGVKILGYINWVVGGFYILIMLVCFLLVFAEWYARNEKAKSNNDSKVGAKASDGPVVTINKNLDENKEEK